MLAAGIVALAAAMWAGLLRLGIQLPISPEHLPGAHGPLMVSGFLGTLISLERAVALGAWWAYASPMLTAAGAILLLAGVGGAAGPILIALGSLALVANFAVIVRRQTELFTIAMAVGAAAWFAGNALWLAGWDIPNLVWWWTAFLVLTIAGERLELSRMRGPVKGGRSAFLLSSALFIGGIVGATLGFAAGLRVMGVGMLGLGVWIIVFDVARRTIRFPGLPRFGAANLLAGAFWLSVAGILRTLFGADPTIFEYDAMLHSVFLGFVFSMIFAHAPIIFPAVLGKPLPFSRIFYLHVVLLQASLVLRIAGDLTDVVMPDRYLEAGFWAWQAGGIFNVVAVTLFIIVTAGAIVLSAVRAAQDTPVVHGVRPATDS